MKIEIVTDVFKEKKEGEYRIGVHCVDKPYMKYNYTGMLTEVENHKSAAKEYVYYHFPEYVGCKFFGSWVSHNKMVWVCEFSDSYFIVDPSVRRIVDFSKEVKALIVVVGRGSDKVSLIVSDIKDPCCDSEPLSLNFNAPKGKGAEFVRNVLGVKDIDILDISMKMESFSKHN